MCIQKASTGTSVIISKYIIAVKMDFRVLNATIQPSFCDTNDIWIIFRNK